MAKKLSVNLGEHFDALINQELKSGRYSSASEVVRAALRLLETEEMRKMALINALVVGERSGRVTGFNSKKHLQKLYRKYL